MAYEHYTIVVDGSSQITSAQDGATIATFAGSSAVGTFKTIIPSRGLLHAAVGKSLRVDNPSPLSLSFPDAGIYVGPFTSGFVGRPDPAMAQMYCQCRWEGTVASVPAGGWIVDIYVLPAEDVPASPGAQIVAEYPTMQQSVKGYFQTSPYDDTTGAFSPVGLHTVGGYDASMIDGLYLPARTPNVWLSVYVPGLTTAGTYSTVYTAPAGLYWRVLYFELMVSSPTTSYYVTLANNAASITGNMALPYSGGGFATTGPHTLPGNGIKAATAGDALRVYSINGVAYSLYGTIGLYVGR